MNVERPVSMVMRMRSSDSILFLYDDERGQSFWPQATHVGRLVLGENNLGGVIASHNIEGSTGYITVRKWAEIDE